MIIIIILFIIIIIIFIMKKRTKVLLRATIIETSYKNETLEVSSSIGIQKSNILEIKIKNK